MKAFVVFAHPERKSMNGALFDTALRALADAGHEVKHSDLYGMGFDPVSDRRNFLSAKDSAYFKQQIEELHATDTRGFAPDIETEIEKLEWCDFMLWQFPLWWFSVPGVLKGWVDRVFAMGRVYGNGRVYDKGVYRGKRALLSLTTGGPRESYERGGFNGDINGILRPIHRGMLWFVGFDVLEPHVVYAPVRQTPEVLATELERFSKRLAGIESETPIEIGEY